MRKEGMMESGKVRGKVIQENKERKKKKQKNRKEGMPAKRKKENRKTWRNGRCTEAESQK